MVASYFNANIEDMEGYHNNEEIASAMTTAVLEDMTTHFLAYCKSWARDGMTWYMFRQGR